MLQIDPFCCDTNDVKILTKSSQPFKSYVFLEIFQHKSRTPYPQCSIKKDKK